MCPAWGVAERRVQTGEGFTDDGNQAAALQKQARPQSFDGDYGDSPPAGGAVSTWGRRLNKPSIIPSSLAPGRIGPLAGGHPHRPSVGLGPGNLADCRCAPGRRLAGCHLCSPHESSCVDHRAALWKAGLSRRMISWLKAHSPETCGRSRSGCCAPGATSWFQEEPDRRRRRKRLRRFTPFPSLHNVP